MNNHNLFYETNTLFWLPTTKKTSLMHPCYYCVEPSAEPTIVTSYLSSDAASSNHEGLRSRQLQKTERLHAQKS